MTSRSDPPLPYLVSREEARAAGMSDRQVSRRGRRQWVRVRRGQFVVPTGGRRPHPMDVVLAAAMRSTSREVVIGHGQAARLWGLPSPIGGWPAPVLLTRNGPHRDRNGIRTVVTPLADDEVVRLPSGLLVTSPVRTVTDCLRVLRPPDALAVTDAAARRLVPAAVLVAAVDGLAGWPGVVQARRLVALADGRRESPLESWSAVAFDDLDVPQPLWQADISDREGAVGRGDSWWSCGVVGESDGKAKYRLRAEERGGADAARLAQVLHEERERERRLRAAGLTVVRWGPRDVLSPRAADVFAAHLRRKLAERAGRTHSADVTPHPFTAPPWPPT
ncbi:MAG: hypothetical protein HY830_27050 [Actinobacteria bacterium]|nr:hypothetical protein [Actinomycetota bacterium]